MEGIHERSLREQGSDAASSHTPSLLTDEMGITDTFAEPASLMLQRTICSRAETTAERKQHEKQNKNCCIIHQGSKNYEIGRSDRSFVSFNHYFFPSAPLSLMKSSAFFFFPARCRCCSETPADIFRLGSRSSSSKKNITHRILTLVGVVAQLLPLDRKGSLGKLAYD